MKIFINEELFKDKGYLFIGNLYLKCFCRKVLERVRGIWGMLDVFCRCKVVENILI